MSNKNGKLSWGEKLAYGMGDSGANVVCALTGTYLTAFYTDTVGIATAAVGTMMLLARIFDGVTDIIMGAIVDKTKTRWGKARPWVLWSAPFMALSIILMFNFPSGMSDSGKLVYAYITYIFQNCIVYTANNLPYNALLARMTLDVQDRATASSLRFIMAQLTMLIVNAITANALATVGWFWLSIIYGVVCMVMLFLCFLGCKEHIGEDKEGDLHVENIPLKTALPALFKNKYFYIQALLFCLFYLSLNASGAMTFYFCNIILDDITLLTYTSMATSLPMIVINFAMPPLVKKFGKQKMMIMGSLLYIIGSILIGAGDSNFAIVLAGLIVKGFGLGPIASGIFAMTADVVDYGEWKTGIRSEGLVNSCTSFGMKVGCGVGAAIGAWLLTLGHYDGTAAVQPESAVNMIRFGYGYLGAVIGVIVLILCFMMNIDKHIGQIQHDLEAKIKA